MEPGNEAQRFWFQKKKVQVRNHNENRRVMTNFSDPLTIFLILSGFAFWGSFIICAIMIIFGIRGAQEAPDERIYRDEWRDAEFEDLEAPIDNEINF